MSLPASAAGARPFVPGSRVSAGAKPFVPKFGAAAEGAPAGGASGGSTPVGMSTSAPSFTPRAAGGGDGAAHAAPSSVTGSVPTLSVQLASSGGGGAAAAALSDSLASSGGFAGMMSWGATGGAPDGEPQDAGAFMQLPEGMGGSDFASFMVRAQPPTIRSVFRALVRG